MTKEFLYRQITKHKYAVLATVSVTNTPESAVVGIAVTPDLKIIFDTETNSRKYKNLLLNPNISFVIGWENEQTIQYEGIAKIQDAENSGKLLDSYYEIFPEGKERKENLQNIAYFYVEPRWIRFSDFNTENGKIEEVRF